MSMLKREKKSVISVVAALLCGAVVCCCILLFARAMRQVKETSDAESLRLAEDAIRRACVTCYCLEGRFPESFAYLREHYALSVDEEKYFVHYSAFAENIMPDITVVRR